MGTPTALTTTDVPTSFGEIPPKVPTTSAPAALMSSREIAELTGKLHTNVLRDIRAMMEELGEPNGCHRMN